MERAYNDYEKGLFMNGNRQMFCWMDSVSPLFFVVITLKPRSE